MAIVRLDQSTSYELINFWNPRIAKRQMLLRYPRGHPLFPRFITTVREVWIALSVTGESHNPQRHWSKNILIEAQFVHHLEETAWEGLKLDTDYLRLETRIEEQLAERASAKFAEFNLEPDIGGIEYFTQEPREYLCIARLGSGKTRERCKCYAGKLPGCRA